MSYRLLEEMRATAAVVGEAARELRLADVPPAPVALGLDDLGVIAVGLALRWPAWVDRREVEIRFVDDATIRITTAVSFRLTPLAIGSDLSPGTMLYVPCDTPKKRTLLKLRILDEGRAALTPLIAARNGDLAGRGLVKLFSGLLQKDGLSLSDPSAIALRELASLPAGDAEPWLEKALDRQSDLGRWLQGEEKDRPEIQIVKDLAEGFLELIQVEYEPDRDRCIEIGYDVPLPWPRQRGKARQWAVALGALSQQRTLKPVAIGQALSTHVEFIAPEDMDLISASLKGKQYDTRNDKQADLRITARTFERSRERAGLHVTLLAGSEIHVDDLSGEESVGAQTTLQARAELQIEGVSDSAEATVSLLPRRSGTIPAAALTSLATAVVLAIFSLRLEELDGETGATVLLLLPAVVAAYLSRPGEHLFTTRALRGTRLLALLSAGCAVMLSGMIAGGFLSVGSTATASAPQATLTTHTSPQVCTARRRTGLSAGNSTTLPPVISCSPGAFVASARLDSDSHASVPAVAQWVAWILASISIMIAVILILSWRAGTLLSSREVLSDEDLALAALVPKHPRSTIEP